ncbi:MAG: DUF4159 domain-containing protein [Verrucomicrobia bacterium]|nr:DUF4159 domain-containing protein [Verrucomicrobiota bacterium]
MKAAMTGRLAARLVFLLAIAASIVFAQYRRSSRPVEGERPPRQGIPDWELERNFKKDVFTFVRVKYDSAYGGWGRRGGGWATDWPDAELNFSYRLEQMTSLRVDPDGKFLELTDEEIFDYPFIYMIEPGAMVLSDEEAACLRRYLLSGGFLMVDDFWGEAAWENFYEQIRRAFPDREPQELSLDHPIFRAVFPLSEKPQMPSIHHAMSYKGTPYQNYERPDAAEVHYKALFDDKGRMMAIICHNTDLGDGWEEEGVDPWYFNEFAEKKAYPMGINIVFYAMTH